MYKHYTYASDRMDKCKLCGTLKLNGSEVKQNPEEKFSKLVFNPLLLISGLFVSVFFLLAGLFLEKRRGN